jgi:hypothetical protein
MTVAELIETLTRLNPDLEVVFDGPSGPVTIVAAAAGVVEGGVTWAILTGDGSDR